MGDATLVRAGRPSYTSYERIRPYMARFTENRWTSAIIPALLIHIPIGTVYCWSVFKQLIADRLHASPASVEWGFSLAIFFLGMSAAFAGPMVEKIRTRLHGLLRGRLRRHGREHRPELPAGRVHLLWRDHGHRPGRRLSDSGQEPDALVRRQQGPRHRHRRRRLRPGQGHCQPTDGISHRHGWPGQACSSSSPQSTR